MSGSIYASRLFWVQTFDRIVRGLGQGFLLGAGVGSAAGDFAQLSWEAAKHGAGGAAGMAALTLAWAIASPPGEKPDG